MTCLVSRADQEKPSIKHQLFHLIVGWKRCYQMLACRASVSLRPCCQLVTEMNVPEQQWRLPTTFSNNPSALFENVTEKNVPEQQKTLLTTFSNNPYMPHLPSCQSVTVPSDSLRAYLLNKPILKDHLTFIPAFAVEATVKQSFALAFVCKTNQDPSLRQSFPHSRLKLICRSSLRSPSKVPTILCESMTWEYAQEWPPLNIREAENIVTPAQLMTTHNKLFLKDMFVLLIIPLIIMIPKDCKH